MFRGSLVLLVGMALVCGLQLGPKMIEAVRESYKIKPYQMDHLADGLNLMRKFTPTHSSMGQRCERYAILLQDFRSSTQFTIAELGINPDRAGYKLRVDFDTLRDLYIQAIDELKQGHIDQSLLDLIECLRTKYWAIDSKARSFLNRNDIKTLIEQYKSVIEQPMEILVDPESRHPNLEGQQLHPALKRTLTDLYHGDESKVELHFPTTVDDDDDDDEVIEPPTEAPEPMPATPRPRAEAVAIVGANVGAGAGSLAGSYADTGADNGEYGYANRATARAETNVGNAAAVAQTNGGNAAAVAQANRGNAAAVAQANRGNAAAVAQANGGNAVGMANTDENGATALADANGNNAAAHAETDDRQGGSASALANTYDNYGAASATATTNTHTDAAAPTDNNQVSHGDDDDDDGESEELSPEEREFLNDVRTNLVAVFDGLPENAEHPDRCFAYSQITSSDEVKLRQPNRVGQIVSEISAKIAAQSQAPIVGQEEEQAFVPEKETRDSFLVVLDAYKPEELGEELWVDILDCVAAWQEIDPDIKVYLQNHPAPF